MLRAVSQVVREVEQGERVAGERGRALAVAAGGELRGVPPEDARPRGRIVELTKSASGRLRIGGSPAIRRATSASTIREGPASIRSMPVARNCSSALSFSASLRRSWSEGTVPGLEPGDVRGRAAREGQLPLGEAGCEAGLLESPTDRRRIVDV